MCSNESHSLKVYGDNFMKKSLLIILSFAPGYLEIEDISKIIIQNFKE